MNIGFYIGIHGFLSIDSKRIGRNYTPQFEESNPLELLSTYGLAVLRGYLANELPCYPLSSISCSNSSSLSLRKSANSSLGTTLANGGLSTEGKLGECLKSGLLA